MDMHASRHQQEQGEAAKTESEEKDIDTSKGSGNRNKQNVAFKRVDPSKWVDKAAKKDNSFFGTFTEQDYGYKAQERLGSVSVLFHFIFSFAAEDLLLLFQDTHWCPVHRSFR